MQGTCFLKKEPYRFRKKLFKFQNEIYAKLPIHIYDAKFLEICCKFPSNRICAKFLNILRATPSSVVNTSCKNVFTTI